MLVTIEQKNKILKKARQLYEHLNRLKKDKTAVFIKSYSSPSIERTPASTPDGNRIERAAEETERIEKKITQVNCRLNTVRQRIGNAINKLPDRRQRQLSVLVYLGEETADGDLIFHNLSEASVIMNYSFRHITRLNKKILQKIDL